MNDLDNNYATNQADVAKTSSQVSVCQCECDGGGVR